MVAMVLPPWVDFTFFVITAETFTTGDFSSIDGIISDMCQDLDCSSLRMDRFF